MLPRERWDRGVWKESDERGKRRSSLLYPNEPSPFSTTVISKRKDTCLHERKKSFLCDSVGSVPTTVALLNLYPDYVLASAAGGGQDGTSVPAWRCGQKSHQVGESGMADLLPLLTSPRFTMG